MKYELRCLHKFERRQNCEGRSNTNNERCTNSVPYRTYIRYLNRDGKILRDVYRACRINEVQRR
jgi:hypothetical protein